MATPPATAGSVLFARYAYPPNELGYCGPADADPLLAHGAAGLADPEIAARARQFDGAWAYLELIASAAGIDDPLDARVVQAYWVGNELLDRVDPATFVAALAGQFRGQVGGFWNRLSGGSETLALPHHSFHVFAVYPWVGLLGSGSDVPLSVLDRCRIRWGQVVHVEGEHAVVRSRPLTWDGRVLALGEEQQERVRWSAGGRSLSDRVAPGDWVASHWDWICDRLSDGEVDALRAASDRQLDLTNLQLASAVPTTQR